MFFNNKNVHKKYSIALFSPWWAKKSKIKFSQDLLVFTYKLLKMLSLQNLTVFGTFGHFLSKMHVLWHFYAPFRLIPHWIATLFVGICKILHLQSNLGSHDFLVSIATQVNLLFLPNNWPKWCQNYTWRSDYHGNGESR